MKIVSSHEVYKCGLFRVTEEEATDPGGFRIKRSIVRHKGSAVMMAVDEKKRILLVRQFRRPAGWMRAKSRSRPRAASCRRRPAIRRGTGKSCLGIGRAPDLWMRK